MNRQTKRLMARQQAATERRTTPTPARRPAAQERKKRVPARQFLKEVRQELKKVNWPTRQELIAYFVVVLVSVVVLTSLVFGLDYFFSKAVLRVFGG
ncbi:MAG: preprotein translocase subunit SecE [Actinomycetota bacterium]|nr:preprotein translocase subunit SecE [Actinomycetota bacterium]